MKLAVLATLLPSASAQADLVLMSPAFEHGASIPVKYTADGEDLSPPLQWSGIPPEAKDLAILCEDPDAPTAEPWVHWVIYGISPRQHELPEGVPAQARMATPVAAMQGVNSFGKIGWSGPQPPAGDPPHRYIWRIFALDSQLALKPGEGAGALRAALRGHVIAEGALTGKFQRTRSAEISHKKKPRRMHEKAAKAGNT